MLSQSWGGPWKHSCIRWYLLPEHMSSETRVQRHGLRGQVDPDADHFCLFILALVIEPRSSHKLHSQPYLLFWSKVPLSYPGMPWTWNPPILGSIITGIIGLHHGACCLSQQCPDEDGLLWQGDMLFWLELQTTPPPGNLRKNSALTPLCPLLRPC